MRILQGFLLFNACLNEKKILEKKKKRIKIV